MFLTGSFTHYDTQYHVVVKSLFSINTWYVYSDIHPEDYFKPPHEQRFFDVAYLCKKNTLDFAKEFCIGALEVKANNTTRAFGNTMILNVVLDNYIGAKHYGYTKDEIAYQTCREAGKRLYKETLMRSDKAFIREIKEGLALRGLEFSYHGFSLNLRELAGAKNINIDLEQIDDKEKSMSVEIINVDRVNMEVLSSMMDVAPYYNVKEGKFIKDYTNVSTKKDLELKVINPLVKEILMSTEPVLIGLDFETDGLEMFDYPEWYTKKSKAVSVQLSWKDNQGVDIYLDMEYFDNVNRDYCLKRLSDLFRWDRGTFTYDLFYDDEGNENHRTVTIDRDSFLLGGHNINFDSRCFRRHGYEVFFDEDTLQMAFTLAPTSFKVSKDLKSLTKFFLGIEPPELKTILGKGNEDKFRYLTDKRVADIYGCSDVDMFRQVWKHLKHLMDDTDPRLYKGYKKLDVYIVNMLAEADFRGVRADVDFIRKQTRFIEEDLKTLERTIYEFVGKSLLMKSHYCVGKSYSEEEFKSAYHEFKITGDDLLNVVYNKLGYPVKVLTKTGKPALNSYAIKKLMFYRNEVPSKFMAQDIMSSTSTEDEPVVLISSKDFNSYKYPLCYLLKEYRTLLKEYTGYFKPFSEIGSYSKIFKTSKTTNIETRRMANPLQTIKKVIKKCIKSYDEDFYLVDWDLAQIELRMFTSLAKDQGLIDKMMDGDTDFHTENGAIIFDVPPHLLPKSDRSKAKTVGFGVPYGLSPKSLCEWMFTEVNQKNMMATYEVLELYEKTNHLSMSLLKSFRAKAREEAYMSPELRRFLRIDPNAPVAIIRNSNGFYRYQDMSNIRGDKGKESSVERAFGNYPIQSFAADYFKYLLIRFDKRRRKEGLTEKIIFHLPIHDESLFSVHKSIDPNFIAKIVKEECMLRLKGHANYFLGLNFGENWYECKQDEAELPVKFLQRNCKAFDEGKIEPVKWCDNPADYFAPKVHEFKKDRVLECLGEYEPNYKQGLHVDDLWNKFTNYTVRSYFYSLETTYTPLREVDKGKLKVDKKGKPIYDSDDRAMSSLMYCLKERGLDDTIIVSDGKQFTVDNYIKYRQALSDDLLRQYSNADVEVEINLDEFDEASIVDSYINPEFWSFDDSESAEDSFFYREDEFDEFEKEINELLKVHKDNYSYVSTVGKTKILVVQGYELAEKLEMMLAKYKDPNGTRVRIDYGGSVDTPAVKYKLPPDSDLNLLISNLHSGVM